MEAQPAGEVFRRRVTAARESAGLSIAELGRRLRDLGFKSFSRQALSDLEAGKRKRVSIDEALAIAWVLGVAPLHLFVPFESPDPAVDEAGEPVDLGDGKPYYAPDKALEVVPDIVMTPVEARAWIRGDAVRDAGDEFPLKQWHRFYVEEVPPPWRHNHPGAASNAGEEAWRRVYRWQQKGRKQQGGKPLPAIPAPLYVKFKKEEQ